MKVIIKKIFKILLWMLLTLVFSIVLFIVLAIFVDKLSDKPKQEEAGPPVATMEYLKPTKEHFNGSIKRFVYRYGSITIDRNYVEYSKLNNDRLFSEISVSWPEFGKREEYYESDESKRLRIMFEIDRSGIAAPQDIYSKVANDLNPYGLEDKRFTGFVGYKRKNGWIYIAKNRELVMPQKTPVVIACSDDESFSYFSRDNLGHCYYHFIFDKDLRAIIRFDKPLMKDFIQVHGDLLRFMDSIVKAN